MATENNQSAQPYYPDGVPRPAADSHLDHLLRAETQEPWHRTFTQNIKDLFNPPKLEKPPADAKAELFTGLRIQDENRGKTGIVSFGLHAGLVALLLAVGTNDTIKTAVKEHVPLVFRDVAPLQPQLPKKKAIMGGGGGGGNRAPVPASQGKLPKIAPRQFVPPTVTPVNLNPKLVMEPTVIAQLDAPLPKVNMTELGDPFARGKIPSDGFGSGGGIGSGSGGGVGSGKGAGVGPGSGGNFGDGVFRIGGGVSSPVLLSKVDPEYSEEARKAKFQGVVVLSLVVDASGRTRDVKVVRALGMGLDEKAIEAVLKWRFRPSTKDGRAVAVRAQAEVNFRLL